MASLKKFELLPTKVVPKNYNIQLRPDLVNFVFEGMVEISVQVKESTNEIRLNSVGLTLSSVEFEINAEEKLIPTETRISIPDETLSIIFHQTLPVGFAKLRIGFKGVLTDLLIGFFRYKFTTRSGELCYGAITNFEAPHARRCFPCWDEPAHKATFDITLTVPRDRVALSNMPEILREPFSADCELDVVKFATSPVMSTYIVCIVIGDYDFLEGVLDNGVKVRVYTPLGRTEHGKFALDVAMKALHYFGEYFSIPYPLPKMDLVSVCNHSVGGMENWGLITLLETCVLVDLDSASAATCVNVASMISHEVAHQWFGNLVTMEWWTDLWLNEGYASFVESLCVDHYFPEYRIWDKAVTNSVMDAMELDCMHSTHPVEVTVSHPDEVDEIFDRISYKKGSSVIRMLYHYLGDEDFRAGMTLYLTRHQYANSVTADLWAALSESSRKPVQKVMNTWTRQSGFPMVTVDAKSDGEDLVLTISQQRFLMSPNSTKAVDGSSSGLENNLWMIPITIATNVKSQKTKILMDEATTTVTLKEVSDNSWVLLNPSMIGFYRIRYSAEMLSHFVPAIKSKELDSLDRVIIMDDLFNMTQAGHSSPIEFLLLLKSYRDETSYTVWSGISECLAKLYQLLVGADCFEGFNRYALNLYTLIWEKVGWKSKAGEDHSNRMLRPLVLGAMGRYGDTKVQSEALRHFEGHVAGTDVIPADIRTAVFRIVASQADEKTLDSLLKIYKEADRGEEKLRICQAIGSVRDPNLLQKVLRFSLSEGIVHFWTIYVLENVSANPFGRKASWEFVKLQHQVLTERYKGGFASQDLVSCTTQMFSSDEMAAEVELHFKNNPMFGIDRVVEQSVENIRFNADWLRRNLDSVNKFFLVNQE